MFTQQQQLQQCVVVVVIIVVVVVVFVGTARQITVRRAGSNLWGNACVA